MRPNGRCSISFTRFRWRIRFGLPRNNGLWPGVGYTAAKKKLLGCKKGSEPGSCQASLPVRNDTCSRPGVHSSTPRQPSPSGQEALRDSRGLIHWSCCLLEVDKIEHLCYTS